MSVIDADVVVVRPLPTAFDPDSGPVTVATPSCCCCCCCCLMTSAAAVTFNAAEALRLGRANDLPTGRKALAMALGLSSVPIAIVMLVRAEALTSGTTAVFTGIAAFALVCFATFKAAGAATWPAVRVALLAALFVSMAFGVELFLAIGTGFLIELFFPLGIWLGIAIARSRESNRSEPPVWPPPGPPTSDGAW
ncbi:MAG: hypothetical protein HKN41_00765 [Ilumatobacter sp.]|nr:hypothetical protein [Ilumatobacter sp.]